MAANQMSEVIEHLRGTTLLREGAGLTDGQLLENYVARRDEAALAALVHRHEPMVWNVCRRILGNYHDAEDAFQATFLVLVRKAASLASPELLGNWLYGVAHQTALKARATAARRRARERQVTEMPEPAVTDQHLWNDLQPLLDQELSRLPDKYRVAIVLCDLEGKTRTEAARQLGVPDGTLAARLARARVLLAKRLGDRGVTLSGVVLASVLAQNVASAATPASVVACTIRAASLFGSGRAAASGAVSVNAAALADGVLKAMLLNKLISATAVLVALAVMGFGAFLMRLPAPAAQTPRTDKPVPRRGAEPGLAGPIVVRQDAILKRMAMSPDGELVATVGVTINPKEDSTVKLWDARTGKPRRALAVEKDSTLNIAFSRDYLAIAVDGNARGQREVRLLDVKTLELKQKIEAPTAQSGSFGWGRLAFSPDGKRLAVAGLAEGAFVKLWDVEKQKLIEGKANLGEIPRDVDYVWDLAFSPDGKLVAAAWLDRKIRLFDGRTGDFRTALDQKLKPRRGDGVGRLAFSPDSKTLAGAGNDHTVALWDLTESPSAPEPERVRALVRQLDDDKFTTREKADREIRRLGLAAAPLLRKELTAVVSNEIRTRLSRILDALKEAEGEPRQTLTGHKGEVDAVAFSKDGRWMASGGRTEKENVYEVILWDARTGKVKQTFSGLTAWVHGLAFSPDGKTLAVCGGAARSEGNPSEDQPAGVKTAGELTLFRLE